MNELVIQNFIVKCTLFYQQNEMYILEAFEYTLIKLCETKGKISLVNPLISNYICENLLVVNTRETLRKILQRKSDLPEVEYFLKTADYAAQMERYISFFNSNFPQYDLIKFLVKS